MSAASQINIVAIVTVPGDSLGEATKAFQTCVLASRREPACLFYDFGQDMGDPERFVASEAWRDEAGLKAHEASPHFQALLKTLEAMKAKVEIMRLASLVPA
ncbi:antibiotic biosynthesis monooxygenase [Formicincola oecophyllae]|uniref:Antibiotic biosynthesis monooxygenase n=1 Tax=Formicincola oecophyllae TaxID=2558361 RepID=A0A4Y6UAT4_9PROT|nr:putative quinol monooxygenase [Formicincola oecophyllae]QDH13567.1 antibiotic biosynthesis monooxygenase [Formicincola oecophyllae]